MSLALDGLLFFPSPRSTATARWTATYSPRTSTAVSSTPRRRLCRVRDGRVPRPRPRGGGRGDRPHRRRGRRTGPRHRRSRRADRFCRRPRPGGEGVWRRRVAHPPAVSRVGAARRHDRLCRGRHPRERSPRHHLPPRHLGPHPGCRSGARPQPPRRGDQGRHRRRRRHPVDRPRRRRGARRRAVLQRTAHRRAHPGRVPRTGRAALLVRGVRHAPEDRQRVLHRVQGRRRNRPPRSSRRLLPPAGRPPRRDPGFGVSLVKAGIRLGGLEVGPVRAPLVDPDERQLEVLRGLLERADALVGSGT